MVDDELTTLPSLGFVCAALIALIYINREKTECHEVIQDINEEIIRLYDEEDEEETDNFEVNSYSFLLKNISDAPNITIFEEQDERPISFDEMINPRRRSFSLNDINSLNLITDSRLQDRLNQAIVEQMSDTTSLASGRVTPCSWDRMSIED